MSPESPALAPSLRNFIRKWPGIALRSVFLVSFAFLSLTGLGPIQPSSSAQAADWPITFTTVDVSAPAGPTEKMVDPGTSQPVGFDPAAYPNSKAIPAGMNFQSVDQISKPGADFAVTEYYFDTDDDPSFILEVKKGSKRHALYTQIFQYKLSPDGNQLLLDNLLRGTDGAWERMKRIINVPSKKTARVPDIDCTRFFAGITASHAITYGEGAKRGDGFGPPRTVCVWDKQGKLAKAMIVPLQNSLANTDETTNPIGLLPRDEATFFQLSYSANQCLLRLQSLTDPAAHREIRMPSAKVTKDNEDIIAAGINGDPCGQDVAVDIDLKDLTLHGGEIRLRVSKTGRADIDKQWSEWQTFR